MAQQTVPKAGDQEILGHWIWVVPILLVVAALSLRQIDLYPPTPDEFFSMFNSGWIANSPYSPIDVLQSLERNSANHTPFYFLLLNCWGQLVGYDVALGRTLTIFAGLLSLAMAYRLCRDFVAPVAGFFALVVVASNAFYNYYIPHVRMYPLLVFISAAVLWLYLRIVHSQKTVKRSDYLALCLASYLLANTQAFSALLFVTIGIYHLAFVPKNRRWLHVSLAIALALLLFSPWISILITQGIDRTLKFWGQRSDGVLDVMGAWIAVALNGSPVLALISVFGMAIGLHRKIVPIKPFHYLFLLFLLVLGLTAQLTGALSVSSMRLTLTGWLLAVLFLVTGIYGLYCLRKWMALLVLLWVVTGLYFQHTADWKPYLAGRIINFSRPPWHMISRIIDRSNHEAPIVGYRFNAIVFNFPAHINYAQNEHYFVQHDLIVTPIPDLAILDEYYRHLAITEPSIWLFYQTSEVDKDETAELAALTQELNYLPCDVIEIGVDTVLLQYHWYALECQPPLLDSTATAELLDYEFYGYAVDRDQNKLLFVDKWTTRTAFMHDDFRTSHQLISEDWRNVAQVDLPLVHEDSLRQFSIDIGDVPAGNYRLMVVLYNNRNGERIDWVDNTDYVPSMQTLTEIVIPES